MELGNLLFGNSRGRFAVPRGIGEDDFILTKAEYSLLNEVAGR